MSEIFFKKIYGLTGANQEIATSKNFIRPGRNGNLFLEVVSKNCFSAKNLSSTYLVE